MNPDLRAIEAAILGEPHDPTNLSPEAASVVLPLVQRVVQERDELREALEEARLTLAAEQGKPEGAPSEGWAPNYETGQFPSYQWRKTFSNGGRVTVDYYPVERRWEWCFMDRPNRHNFPWVRNRFRMTAREAMIEVDRALTPR